jgi:hypothetical protein
MNARALASAGVLLLFCCSTARGQVANVNNGVAGWTYRTNFAIPDAPAYELLGVEPSTILRPQTARELTLGFAKFRAEDGSVSLPHSVAIEFSPGLLVNHGALTQESYENSKALYSTRLSMAVLTDSVSGKVTRITFGGRVTLNDDEGFGTDSEFPVALQITPLLERGMRITQTARTRTVKDPANARRRPNEIETILNAGEKAEIQDIEKEIRQRWAERYWNVDVLDVAVAGRLQSADSLGHGAKLDAISVWATRGEGFGHWGQLLFGGRGGTARDSLASKLHGVGSLAVRMYAGSNRAKAFAESQADWNQTSAPRWYGGGGLEVAATNWMWLNFVVGSEAEGHDRGKMTSSFKLKTALPG